MSVMRVQAGAARLSMDTDPDRARQVLISVEETAREAVGSFAACWESCGPATSRPS